MRPLIGIVARAEYPGGTKHLSLNEAYRIKLNSHGADAFMILPSQPIDYSTVRYGEQGSDRFVWYSARSVQRNAKARATRGSTKCSRLDGYETCGRVISELC